ncbi:hypothetical protein LTR37_006922 [Vermiconidia calcicola]|uniref:Uncharacterized protein n=1 Tax=Vermiconidia calcicola TaxID=1690605 RepID=A0ACC3NF78_9PEZI|nr:hypothetical protein LTR37_006922 [Vermiconidia calcicola]
MSWRSYARQTWHERETQRHISSRLHPLSLPSLYNTFEHAAFLPYQHLLCKTIQVHSPTHPGSPESRSWAAFAATTAAGSLRPLDGAHSTAATSAIVTAFIEEIYKRVTRQGLNITANTHLATLHLGSATGAIIDCEDVLGDVVTDPKTEKLFAVFAKKQSASAFTDSVAVPGTAGSASENGHDNASSPCVRVVKPATSKIKHTCPVLRVPLTLTIRQLHDRIAEQLKLTAKVDDDAEMFEDNCKLAQQLANDPSLQSSFLVVHGKSVVERLDLDTATEGNLKSKLRERFGVNIEDTKKVVLLGAGYPPMDPTALKKVPVVAICSKKRHVPTHARVDVVDETGQRKSRVLDLHTSEQPIHPACMNATLEDSGLHALATDGVVDIYAVERSTTGQNATAVGKSAIFRSRAHWEPEVVQSDRGIAMFLSSLRVFASLVQEMGREDDRSQDSVLHTFDLLTTFPPALRTLNIIIQGKTPTPSESSALSHVVFRVLESFVPTEIIGTDRF